MTSISPSTQPQLTGSSPKDTTPATLVDDSISMRSDTDISFKEDRLYTKLNALERVGILAKIIISIALEIFTFGLYQCQSQMMWEELISGERKIKAKVLDLNDVEIDFDSDKTQTTRKTDEVSEFEFENDDDAKEIFVEESNTPDPLITDGEPSSPKPIIDASEIDEALPIDNDEIFDEEDDKESATSIEIIKRDDIHNPNVIHWLELARKDTLLQQTDLYNSLNDIHAVFENGNEKLLAEGTELVAKYLQHKDEILAIKNAVPEHVADNIRKLTDELVFNALRDNYVKINDKVNHLRDIPNGKFKTKMQALLKLIHRPSPSASTSIEQPITATQEIKEAVTENNDAVEAAIKDFSTLFVDFEDFQNQIIEPQNIAAKEAFIIFTEILRSQVKISEKSFHGKLIEYNRAEAAIQKAIKDLVDPIQMLADINKTPTDMELSQILLKMNEVFKSISLITNKPSLKNLLIQNIPHITMAYQLLKERKSKVVIHDLQTQIQQVLHNMQEHLGASDNERINFIITLGKKALSDPNGAFNKYLEIKGGLQFVAIPPENSLNIEKLLTKINDHFDERTYSAEDLIALETFTSMALYSYIINPRNYSDSSFKSIADLLGSIRSRTTEKLNASSAIKAEVVELRKSEQNQKFYQFLKVKMENTPYYPKDFWFDSSSAKKMKTLETLAPMIGVKIANPESTPGEPIQLVHINSTIGYEIYLHPGSGQEKPKLLLFIPKAISSSVLQGMNHQLGLFGDSTILAAAQDIFSNITSTEVLEGFQHDLIEGNLEIIASGFDNGGATATILANKLATLYPKTEVTSIAAGSTTVVTTEEAYNMNKAKNFLPIRLKYGNDKNVDRQIGSFIGDFSENIYRTFPLAVRYNLSYVDINKHNKEEYGNIDNFIPALKNPVILKDLYQEVCDHIIYSATLFKNVSDKEKSLEVKSDTLDENQEDIDVDPTSNLLHVGRIDDLVKFGFQILAEANGNFDGAFLKFDQEGLSISNKTTEILAIEKAQAEAIKKDKEAVAKPAPGWFSSKWGASAKTISAPIKTSVLTQEEQEITVVALQQTIIHLKDPEIIKLLSPEKAFALFIAAETLLVNYTKINANVGKLPQLVDLISEMRQLTVTRLEDLYLDKNQREAVSQLFKTKRPYLIYLATKVTSLNPHYEHLLSKNNVLGKIDFEDQFLEFLGFKIAVKDQDKIGSDVYVAKLHTDSTHNYDMSLFTPQDPKKKQRIVISCNGLDQLGAHTLVGGVNFGAGDAAIIKRAEALKTIITDQLKTQFSKHDFDAGDIDIVVTGFGSEGAVATALGYLLAKEHESANCQVQTVGFGAPRFTTEEGAKKIQAQQNFVPIRFLSPADTRFEWKLSTMGDLPLSDKTYYTIPFEFRIVGALELGGHNTNLYGDVQGIKTSMKSAYQLREVVQEKMKWQSPATLGKGELKSTTKGLTKSTTAKSSALPKRVKIDTRHTTLVELSAKTVAELQTTEPGKLIRIMKYCIELSESDVVTEEDKLAITGFFAKFITAIRNEDINENHLIENIFYKKMLNHGYKPNQLFAGKWKLQQIISKDLEDAMNAIKNMDPSLDLKAKEELILKRSFYRGVLAADLNGNRYKPAGGGVNGAMFFRHLESGLKIAETLLPGETSHVPFLGVFKPHPETVREFKGWFDLTQWGERIKAVAGMDANLNKTDPHNRVHNEIFAYELFHIFGFNAYIGFPTTLKFTNKNDVEARPASFCAFIPGLDIVGAHVESVTKKGAISNLLDQVRTYSDQELHIWQMSKIFDFLTGNMDGHEGNAFVKVEHGKVVGAVNFDYDKAFANVKTKGIGNQYKWANLEISKNDFTAATRKALKEMLKKPHGKKKITAFLTKARADGVRKENFTEAQENLLRERIEVLHKVINGEIQQLSDLQKYK